MYSKEKAAELAGRAKRIGLYSDGNHLIARVDFDEEKVMGFCESVFLATQYQTNRRALDKAGKGKEQVSLTKRGDKWVSDVSNMVLTSSAECEIHSALTKILMQN